MNDRIHIISMLRDEFDRWEEFLDGISEEQITAPNRIDNLSIKDIVAHLTTWQQISVARLEAALDNKEPEFSMWPAEFDPDIDDVDPINAWIYESQRGKPWTDTHREWRERYMRFLKLAEAIPEKDLMEAGRFRWIAGNALSAVLLGAYEHHEEHLDPLLDLVRRIS